MGELSPPAGWYEDPAKAGQQRYWDGFAWTNDVRDPKPWEPPAEGADQERLAFAIHAYRRAITFGTATPNLSEFGIRSKADFEEASRWEHTVFMPAYEEKLRNTPWPEMFKGVLQEIQWRFSLYGLVVLVLGLMTLVGTAVIGWLGIPVGLVLLGFAAYIFAGGKTRLWFF